jgi:hypothetical protein
LSAWRHKKSHSLYPTAASQRSLLPALQPP